MSSFKTKVIFGNTVLYPEVVKKYLTKSNYFLFYDEEKLTLNVNHGFGEETILEIRQVSHESAAKVAEILGLKSDGESQTSWSKRKPILHLYHDGSDDAEVLRVEMLKLEVPHTVTRGHKILFRLMDDEKRIYEPPEFSLQKMKEIVQKTAKIWNT